MGVLTVQGTEGSLGAAVLKGNCVDAVGGPAVMTDTASNGCGKEQVILNLGGTAD